MAKQVLNQIGESHLSSFFKQVIPYLGSKLVSQEELAKLSHLENERLGAVSISHLLFECPLAGDRKWVDLSFRINPYDTSTFQQSLECIRAGPSLCSKKYWEQCSRLFQILDRKCTGYGVELDTGSRFESSLTPNVFLGIGKDQGSRFSHFVEEIFCETGNRILSSEMKENLERCENICSQTNATIFLCGFMMARLQKDLRIHWHSRPFNLDALRKQLAFIGYPYSSHPLVEFLERIPPSYLNHVGVAVDIGDAVGPKVGIEIFESSLEGDKMWGPLLSLFAEAGLTRKEPVENWLDWVGASPVFEDSINCSIYSRDINHLKLNYHPNHGLEAKIYLIARHKSIPLAELFGRM